MTKLVNHNLYEIYELYNKDDKIILYIKILSINYDDNYINYRNDLLELYNKIYKELNRKMYIIIDMNSLENSLFKIINNELLYFKENINLLEFIIHKIYVLKEKSILSTVFELMKPFMFKSKVETVIKKNLKKSLIDILD
jgi:hypothetical protein